MLISAKTNRNLDPITHIWSRIEIVRIALNLSHEKIASLLHLTQDEFEKLKSEKREPSISSVMLFCENLNVGFSAFMSDDIDTVALVNHFNGKKSYIPEKYTVGANSKKRTVINLLNFIEEHYGWERKVVLLRRFQMNEGMFADPDGEINMRLSVDLTDCLKRYFSDDEIFLKMGKNAVATYKQTELGRQLEIARRPIELYEMMFDGLSEKFVEKNFKWSIAKKASTGLIIEGKPNVDVFSVLGADYMRSKTVSLVRQGFLSSIPGYLGYSDAPVSRLKCVSQGDDICSFMIHLNPEHQRAKVSVVS